MRYFFKLLIGYLIWMCGTTVHAQNYPVYNSFYVNPYLYNPAEVLTDYTYVYLTHRQQWLSIEGAPMLTSLSFTTLLHESHNGIGMKLSSYKRGLLTTSDVTATYAYALPISKKNWLSFGLSGGIISNTIDFDKATDPTDPALLNSNNLQPVANFGMLLRTESGLNFGVSLPQLLAPIYNGEGNFSNTNFIPFDNVFVTAYYRKKIQGKMVSRKKGGMRAKVKSKETIAPLEFYLNYKYAATGNSQFEVLGKLNLTQNFWLGASYRMPYGFTANMGITYDRFIFSYSYEPGSQPEKGFSQGTHEILLGLRLGDQKKFKRASPVLRSTLQHSPTENHAARFQENTEDPDNIAHQEITKKKYYVVIRSFGDFLQADAYKRKLIEQKFNAEIFYYEKDKKYYVHVLETSKSGEANEEVKNLKDYTKMKSASVLTVTTQK